MATLKYIIDSFSPVDENEILLKETLQILLELSNLKIKSLEKEIEKNLISGIFPNFDFKIPVSNIILKKSEQLINNLENENVFIENILYSLSEYFKCNQDMKENILKTLNDSLISLVKTDSNEMAFSFLASEGTNIVRYDLLFYNKNLYSPKIRKKIQSNFIYIITKSNINIRTIAFNDFFNFYSTFLEKYFNDDEKIKINLTEMRDIYSICLSE